MPVPMPVVRTHDSTSIPTSNARNPGFSSTSIAGSLAERSRRRVAPARLRSHTWAARRERAAGGRRPLAGRCSDSSYPHSALRRDALTRRGRVAPKKSKCGPILCDLETPLLISAEEVTQLTAKQQVALFSLLTRDDARRLGMRTWSPLAGESIVRASMPASARSIARVVTTCSVLVMRPESNGYFSAQRTLDSAPHADIDFDASR